jgi:hypothetical protein
MLIVWRGIEFLGHAEPSIALDNVSATRMFRSERQKMHAGVHKAGSDFFPV